jgi:hypothetical protein
LDYYNNTLMDDNFYPLNVNFGEFSDNFWEIILFFD